MMADEVPAMADWELTAYREKLVSRADGQPMIRLCSCGFGTDDDDWFVCHLIEHPEHHDEEQERYSALRQ
jgi:hypothetical protein